ncbi:MAG TPA: twin-arginine translocation signal domain-containing protein, partial [Acidobacteriaceae bacterium]|nr:twin-arginine translocation signal domain-containing protein [Acidobacteriaceae bacterium]
MDRRGFLKGGALAAVTAALKPPASGAREHQRNFALQNPQLAWHLQSTADGIRSVAFENRISGRRFALQAENEFRLTFSSGQRLEIPWWDFRLGDETPVPPERESGVSQGFHAAADVRGWRPVNNLSGGQHGRAYGGYGWFRCKLEIPESAEGKDIVLVLGGYDEQDWNDYWVYLNGQQIGRRTSSGRWRKPGRFTLRSSDSLYASLRFGSSNLLAV